MCEHVLAIICHYDGICCCETHIGLVPCVGGTLAMPVQNPVERTLSGHKSRSSTNLNQGQAYDVHGLFLHKSPLQPLVTVANAAWQALHVHAVRAAVWHKVAKA